MSGIVVFNPADTDPAFHLRRRLDALKAAIAWSVSLGVKAESRFITYRQTMEKLIDLVGLGDRDGVEALGEQAMNSLFEANTLVNIHEALRAPEYASFVRTRLHDLKGSEFVSEEDPAKNTNKSRNFLFELSVASLFVRGGKAIDIQAHEQFDTDVILKGSRGPFFIQCKRPQSENAVEGRYVDALRQLRTNLGTCANANARGVVALDLSRVRDSHGRVLWVDTLDEANANFGSYTSGYLNDHRHLWGKDRKHDRAIMVMLHLGAMTVQGRPIRNVLHVEWNQLGYVKNPPSEDDLSYEQELQRALNATTRSSLWQNFLRGNLRLG